MIYDITQEYFSGEVYPGDPKPTFRRIKSFDAGDQSTVTEITDLNNEITELELRIKLLKAGV